MALPKRRFTRADMWLVINLLPKDSAPTPHFPISENRITDLMIRATKPHSRHVEAKKTIKKTGHPADVIPRLRLRHVSDSDYKVVKRSGITPPEYEEDDVRLSLAGAKTLADILALHYGHVGEYLKNVLGRLLQSTDNNDKIFESAVRAFTHFLNAQPTFTYDGADPTGEKLPVTSTLDNNGTNEDEETLESGNVA